jgi:hypothetical protein
MKRNTPRKDNGQFGHGSNSDHYEVGAFGKKFTEYHHNAQGAIEKLRQERSGEAIGALYHPTIGDIDLIWGEEGDKDNQYAGGYGLAKIIGKHPEVVNNLQDVINQMEIEKPRSGANRLRMSSSDGKYKAVVRLTWEDKKQQWLLTAFEVGRNKGVIEKRTGTFDFSGASDTALHSNTLDKIIEQRIMEFQAKKDNNLFSGKF